MKVKAGGRRVPVGHALERHVVAFLERLLSEHLQGDVLCGVCAEKMADSAWNNPAAKVGETYRVVLLGKKKRQHPSAIILLMTNLYAAEPAESQ